ncbi:Sec-independent protein translocase subunit TatA/TatB [Thermus thermamylovorans]|uniref:Sec-independent protein translocase protein TatA n=1 Tax=Thermus thermamylovorans TaxID=2509362 RepID=A0A4Q9B5Z4_9DEIN|nr:twin-arginine translocase TatA/TatE family subunit [Thermus thermamylovorans]TBH21126.1 twin-arginine translocase TatA/TatE family subunit [Thermus thermamylovorans]
MSLGPMEILVILLIALLLFGPKKLPELGRSLGQSIREFKRGAQEIREELERSMDVREEPRPKPAPAPAGAEASVPPKEEKPAEAEGKA